MLPAAFQILTVCSTLPPRCCQPMKPTNLPFLSLYFFLFFLSLVYTSSSSVRLSSIPGLFAMLMYMYDSTSAGRTDSPCHLRQHLYPQPVSTTATTIAIPKTTFISDDPVASCTSYLSSTSTIMIACIIPIIAMMYLVVLSWAYQYASKSPKALNKTSGVWLQKYAPGMDSSS
jgi:hypothetical protein